MKRVCWVAGAGIFLASAWPQAASPCSTFCFEAGGRMVFGRNYDWPVDEGLVVVNRRHVSVVAATGDHPAGWTSKYGSVTFNQYGCGFPHGGMNEAGLVVEQMWLDATRYPETDARAGLGNLQWIQYQLDNCRSVAEVLSSDRQVRIVPNKARIHYLVCDAAGECAAIEFLDGKMVVHTGDALPFRVLTNDTYARSAAYVRRFRPFGGSEEIPRTASSLDRFARAADLVRRPEAAAGDTPAEKAFAILDDVSQGAFTQWQIVYEPGERRISFRTRRSPEVRTISLTSLDFSCRQPPALLDIHTRKGGDVAARFRPYTHKRNRALVRAAYRKTELTADLPDEVLEAIARYPEAAICRE